MSSAELLPEVSDQVTLASGEFEPLSYNSQYAAPNGDVLAHFSVPQILGAGVRLGKESEEAQTARRKRYQTLMALKSDFKIDHADSAANSYPGRYALAKVEELAVSQDYDDTPMTRIGLSAVRQAVIEHADKKLIDRAKRINILLGALQPHKWWLHIDYDGPRAARLEGVTLDNAGEFTYIRPIVSGASGAPGILPAYATLATKSLMDRLPPRA